MGKLEECRLRLDPRFLTPAGKKTATERPLYCAATWIRTRLPPGATLFDLKVYKSDQTDGLTSWFGRVRLREDHLAKLLPHSGEAGLFIRPKRSAVREEVCWYPDGESSPDAALKDAWKYGGRVVANRRGLGICVAADKIRAVSIAIHGESVGLRGCPTYSVVIPRDRDPACIAGWVHERLEKDGRRVWFREAEEKPAEFAKELPRENATDAPPVLQAVLSQPPTKQSYLAAAKRRNNRYAAKQEETAAAAAVTTVPGSALAFPPTPVPTAKSDKARKTREDRLLAENKMLKEKLDLVEARFDRLEQLLARAGVVLPADLALNTTNAPSAAPAAPAAPVAGHSRHPAPAAHPAAAPAAAVAPVASAATAAPAAPAAPVAGHSRHSAPAATAAPSASAASAAPVAGHSRHPAPAAHPAAAPADVDMGGDDVQYVGELASPPRERYTQAMLGRPTRSRTPPPVKRGRDYDEGRVPVQPL